MAGSGQPKQQVENETHAIETTVTSARKTEYWHDMWSTLLHFLVNIWDPEFWMLRDAQYYIIQYPTLFIIFNEIQIIKANNDKIGSSC